MKGTHLFCSYMCALSEILRVGAEGAIFNRRKLKSSLDQIFNSTSQQVHHVIHAASFRVENSAQIGKVCP